MEIDMTKRSKKILGKVDFTTWELPKTIDFHVYEKLKDLSDDIEKLIDKTADKHLNFENSVKKAASEAIEYALEYNATLSFCERKNPKTITVGFPLGYSEGITVDWDIDFSEAIKSYAHSYDYYKLNDKDFEDKYKGLITLLKESADFLEKRFEKAKKEKS
jgi:hypothetical protein